MSKSKNKRKERQEEFTMDFHEPVSIDSLVIDDHGNVKMYSGGIEQKPENVHFEKWYEGENRNKVTVCYDTSKMNMDMYAILYDYNYLIALDTNSCGYTSYSVGLIYRINIDSTDETKWCLESLTGVSRIFDNRKNGEGNSSELVALHELISFLRDGNFINDFNEKTSLFVVDHNRALLDAYNSQRKQLLSDKPDSLIPHNVHLIYATSDKPNDSIFNRIIKECDDEAKHLKIYKTQAEMLLHVNTPSSKGYFIDKSKYDIVDSGCQITDKMPYDMELRCEDTEKALDIIIHLIFKNDEGDLRTNARFFNLKAYLLCLNYQGVVGLGLADPLVIGELNGKQYFLKCWISNVDSVSETKKVDYVIYAEK